MIIPGALMKKKRFVKAFAAFFAVSIIFGGITFCQQKDLDISEFYKEIELFSDAISLVIANYIDNVKPKELIYGALKGMLSSLDEYSQFLEPDNFKEMKIETEGRFGGLGIEIGTRGGMLTIISPIDGTPAEKAGLKPGDIIVKIDGEITKNIVLYDAVKNLRGKVGSPVILSIWREKEERFFDISLVREMIEINSIKEAKVFEDDIGYVKLVEFQEKTSDELGKDLDDLMQKNIKGLILDLRNNPGGLLESSIDVSDLFLKKGTLIVSTKGKKELHNKEYFSKGIKSFTDITLVVLVNEGSASASEIVAGAIKDNKRGIVVGSKTYGKGSVQTVIQLKDESALRITTAEYFTPGNYSIQKKGILPDIIVDLETENKNKEDEKKDIFEELDEDKETKEKEKPIDNQIKAAINIIKAINLEKKNTKVQ